MRCLTKTTAIAALALAVSITAQAELQNVLVNGSIRIRGNVYDFDDGLRAGGQRWDDRAWVEQRTRLGVRADFTQNVSSFIELDSYDTWGTDFRSDYVTGVDRRAGSFDDVEVYQGYIEATDMWDTPVYLRAGRQEVALGSQWLMGVNDTSAFFRGLSFDGIVAGYATDMVDVKALWLKLNENYGDFGDDDIDLYGVYGSYLGLEDIVLDAYWLFLQDDAARSTAEVDIHTVGLRGAGALGAFDFEAEVAYQFGEYDFPAHWWWDPEFDVDVFGVNLQAGYTFDFTWQPRVFAGFAWFEGAQVEDDSWPFDDKEDKASFNRLFSNWEYSEFIDNTDLSNAFIYQAGLSARPTESLRLDLVASYYRSDEARDGQSCCWQDVDIDKDLGYELGLYANYDYSDDLAFRAGYAHFWAEDGLEDISFSSSNGLQPLASDGNADFDYFFLETLVSF